MLKECLVAPDALMTMGPDEQYVVAAATDVPRDALHLRHARYWLRPDGRRSPVPTRSSCASGRRPPTMAEEPAPPPPKLADLGGTPPAPAVADAPKDERESALEEVSALLAASETRMAKLLALRFAELGEALSGLAKAVEAPAEQAAPEPSKDDGKAAAADLEKWIRAFAADFDRWRELQRNDNRRLFLAGGSAAVLLLLGLFLQAQTGILPRRDPTNGWKDHVWKKYGAEMVDCELKFRTEEPPIRCEATAKDP